MTEDDWDIDFSGLNDNILKMINNVYKIDLRTASCDMRK